MVFVHETTLETSNLSIFEIARLMRQNHSNNNIAHPEMEIDLDKYYCLYC